MGTFYEGLPAAADVEQSMILAQLHFLRHLEATRASMARTVLPSLEAPPR